MATFDSTKTRLDELLKDIKSGRIQLPDFQRGWVWDDEHIRSLLVSIARSFPVGAIMLLENGGAAKFKMRLVEGLCPDHHAPEKVEKLILDGQQRLTSLTQVLKLSQPVKTRNEKRESIERFYYIDIERALLGPDHYEEAFISVGADKTLRTNFGKDIVLDLRTRELEFDAFHFPCNEILDRDRWEDGLISYDQAKFRRYMEFRHQVLDAFKEYDVPVIELKKNNRREAVCLVFEKVNTGGVPLSVFELMTATYAAEAADANLPDGWNLRDEWYGSKKNRIEGISQKLHKTRLLADTQPTDFFQSLSLLHTYHRRRNDIAAGKIGKQVTGVSAKRESVLALPLLKYREFSKPLISGFFKAAKFLRKESFFSKRDLPYRTQIVPLASVLTLLGDHWLEPVVYDRLCRWFWCGVLGELYGGAVETRMANDVQELMDWVDGGTTEPSTVHDANFQSARLGTLRTRNSAAYKGINVLIQRNGARDLFWKSSIRELDEGDWEECKLDIHHIFPQKWCLEHEIEPKRFNSILNKTPISYKANRMIGGSSPSEYLLQLQNHKTVMLDDAGMDAVLRTHFIEPAFLRANDFDGFIESRRELLLDAISTVMGKMPVDVEEIVAVDDGSDDEEEAV